MVESPEQFVRLLEGVAASWLPGEKPFTQDVSVRDDEALDEKIEEIRRLIAAHQLPFSAEAVDATSRQHPNKHEALFLVRAEFNGDLLALLLSQLRAGERSFNRKAENREHFAEVAEMLLEAEAQGLVTIGADPHKSSADGELDSIPLVRLTAKGRAASSGEPARETRHESATTVETADVTKEVFISYRWETDEHKAWVRQLASRLVEDRIPTALDQFDLQPGMDLAHFVETSIRNARHVLLVCTPAFKERADAGHGGVGYEKSIITGELLIAHPETRKKFVPLLRTGSRGEALPSYLKTSVFIDFSDQQKFEPSYKKLVRHIYGEPEHRSPPLGSRPDFLDSGRESTNQVAVELCRSSEHGLQSDPLTTVSAIAKSHGLTRSEVEVLVDELSDKGHVIVSQASDPRVQAAYPLFWDIDRRVMGWSSEEDARKIATLLVAEEDRGLTLPALQETLGWELRRLNPAAEYLAAHNFCQASDALAHPLARAWLRATVRTRRFLAG